MDDANDFHGGHGASPSTIRSKRTEDAEQQISSFSWLYPFLGGHGATRPSGWDRMDGLNDYTLVVMTNSSPWYRWPMDAHRNRWFTYWKWWFSMAMLVITRGYSLWGKDGVEWFWAPHLGLTQDRQHHHTRLRWIFVWIPHNIATTSPEMMVILTARKRCSLGRQAGLIWSSAII